jgi:mannose-1-phosphate guanylyltransferase
VRAVVLVGGEGTRLRPLTLTTPKQMLPVGGRPMLERVLERLAKHGIDEVVLSLGYRPDAFLDAYPAGTCVGVKLVYAVEDEPLDTAGAIRFAAGQAAIDETFLAVNGDVLTDLDLTNLVAFHRDRDAEATIALTPVEDPSAFGVVPTDPRGQVIAFIEKPPRAQAPTNLINAGTYVLEPGVLESIPTGRRVSIERETFPALVQNGRLYAMGSDADWLDAGTPATFLAANLRYADGNAGCIASGVDVDARARVTGSVLGPRVTVGRGAVVEGSVCFEGARIARDSHVRASIVGRDALIESGAVVADLSLVGDRAIVPSGARLSAGRAHAT